jgi:hypothetical protein
MTNQNEPIYPLNQLVVYFLKPGTTVFGGHAALVGYMYKDPVERHEEKILKTTKFTKRGNVTLRCCENKGELILLGWFLSGNLFPCCLCNLTSTL